jgi:hypothetical protein
MHVQWQTHKSYEASFVNFKDNSFEMNQSSTAYVGFSAGQKLDRAYSATVVGKQTRKQTYVFYPDGTYQFSDKPVTGSDGAPATATGKYRVSSEALEWTASSGLTRLSAYPFPDGASGI